MFGAEFYNETTRRYVAMFGTLFNDISIGRSNAVGEIQRMKVPINYGPMAKFLSKTTQDPNNTAPAISLPRMSFMMTSMQYDGSRKLTDLTLIRNSTGAITRFSPAPYNLSFELNIMTKYAEDGLKIIEQILPYFRPAVTLSAKLLDEMDGSIDIPIELNSIMNDDNYEGPYDEHRTLTWTLQFTLKGYYYGPSVGGRKVIKFATVNTYSSLDATIPASIITVQPGLTANGQPTSDITQTIPYANIDADDDWTFIVIQENNDG